MPSTPRFPFSVRDLYTAGGILKQIVSTLARAALTKMRPLLEWSYRKFAEFAEWADPFIVRFWERTTEPRSRALVFLGQARRFLNAVLHVVSRILGFPFALCAGLIQGILRALVGDVRVEFGTGGLVGAFRGARASLGNQA
ncbi:MAG: hypothetical protein HY042_02590, partial [Spirochaetia bacterium]|nr:hypothetical protein [Spirochaetia bacterium]